MRSWRATKNLIAVSANAKETAINTEQTLDTSMLADLGSVINLSQRRETNKNEMTGKEEPDTIYDLGATVEWPFSFPKMQPQHAAFIGAFGLGAVSSSAAGAGYEHTITPKVGDEDADRSNPTFTAGQRYGDTVLKRRFASLAVDNFSMSFAADDWVKLSGSCKGTGKVADNMNEETVNVTPGADPFPLGTSLTLAANAVEGASAAERLQNVQRIRVELSSGEWTDVAYTAVSDATPAVITIEAINANDINAVDFKVLYIPTESGWMTFPARVTETPLRVAQATVKFGGAWDGSAFQGGRQLKGEIDSVVWDFKNNMDVKFVPGAGDAYAARIYRNGRSQTLKFNREFREYILQQHIDDNDTCGIYILVSGGAIDGSHNYQAELIFPKCGVIKAPVSVKGQVLAEAGDLQVLEDDTYGSVILKVKNLQSAYAA